MDLDTIGVTNQILYRGGGATGPREISDLFDRIATSNRRYRTGQITAPAPEHLPDLSWVEADDISIEDLIDHSISLCPLR